MTNARAIEYRITQQLLRQREGGETASRHRFTERLITAAAVTAVLLLLGSCAQELMWAILGAAGVLTLGTRCG
jgi:hypothetical protein